MSGSQDTTAPAADQGCGDKRRLVKTKTPGVFKRIDGKGKTIGYACVYRSGARQRKRHARTYEEAKRLKRESETDRDRGELQERSAITFRRYLDEWVDRYRGQGRRGLPRDDPRGIPPPDRRLRPPLLPGPPQAGRRLHLHPRPLR